MQRHRAGDQREFEIAFPVWTHDQLLWFETRRGGCGFEVAGVRLSATNLCMDLAAAGTAKKRGPLQAVPVMARAIAERLG